MTYNADNINNNKSIANSNQQNNQTNSKNNHK